MKDFIARSDDYHGQTVGKFRLSCLGTTYRDMMMIMMWGSECEGPMRNG